MPVLSRFASRTTDKTVNRNQNSVLGHIALLSCFERDVPSCRCRYTANSVAVAGFRNRRYPAALEFDEGRKSLGADPVHRLRGETTTSAIRHRDTGAAL